jgi:hypothetical protein
MPSPSPASNPLRQWAKGLRALRQRHEERHRPTGFGFVLADRIDYLDAQSWDAVAHGASVFLRRDVLRVIERHGPENLQPRYATIFREDKPVAVLAAQVISVTGDRLRREEHVARENPSRNLLRRALSPAARAVGGTLRERILVAGNLLSWGFHGIAFSAEENPAEVWPGLAEALYRIRRAERLSGQTNLVLVKDFTSRQTGLEALGRFSYRPLATDPDMVLSIDPAWKSYDDYLGALDAKYRRNAKDQLKKLAAASCTLEPLKDLHAHATRLHQHYLAVHDNASIRLVTLRESYLPGLALALGENFRCQVLRRGAELLGFVTSVRDGDTAIAYYIGFDRAAAATGLPLYLRLLHATIGDAIAWKCTRLSLGRTALEPKAALGAKPEPMFVWLRHRLPAMNWLVRGVLGAVPHQEAPERNPFKSGPEPARGKE